MIRLSLRFALTLCRRLCWCLPVVALSVCFVFMASRVQQHSLGWKIFFLTFKTCQLCRGPTTTTTTTTTTTITSTTTTGSTHEMAPNQTFALVLWSQSVLVDSTLAPELESDSELMCWHVLGWVYMRILRRQPWT